MAPPVTVQRSPQPPPPAPPPPAAPAKPTTPPKAEGPAKADGAQPKDTFDRSLPISTRGWSEADVKKEARDIDSNKDGKISEQEVAAFRQRARAIGVQDPRAALTFQKYEAGAALAASQDKTPGRQMDKAYLDGAFTRELQKTGASTAEVADIRRTIVQQSDAEVAADVIPELRAGNGLDKARNDAARGVLGGDTTVIDTNHDGKIDGGDRVISSHATGKAESGVIPNVDEVNGAAGVNEVIEGHKAHGAPAFMPAKPKSEWFPQKHWDYDDSSQNWKLKPGVPASEAIQYYRDHPNEFSGDCGAMKQLAAQSGLMEQLGTRDYDALAKKEGLAIGFSTAHNSAGLSKKIIREEGQWGDSPSSYPPGAQGYAHLGVPGDPAATAKLKDLNWAGEHFVVTQDERGQKVVVAHPFGPVPAHKFEEELRKTAARELSAEGYVVREEDIQVRLRPRQVYDLDKARELAWAP